MLATTAGGLAALVLSGCSEDQGRFEQAAAADPSRIQVSPERGSLRGGTRVVVRGNGLEAVRSARVGGVDVPVRRHRGALVLTTPACAGYRAGAVTLRLRSASGGTVATAPWRYAALDGIDRQLAYVLRYWKHYNPGYPPLGTTDCVDFTSQSLLQRGWRQQGAWTHAANVYRSGAAWISSTAFRDFMGQHPELGTALTDAQRPQVKVGDVVQFDWDRTGDRDHTGVVTRVVHAQGRTRVLFAGHTLDSAYRDVDEAITKDHPGGAAYYWSLR